MSNISFVMLSLLNAYLKTIAYLQSIEAHIAKTTTMKKDGTYLEKIETCKKQLEYTICSTLWLITDRDVRSTLKVGAYKGQHHQAMGKHGGKASERASSCTDSPNCLHHFLCHWRRNQYYLSHAGDFCKRTVHSFITILQFTQRKNSHQALNENTITFIAVDIWRHRSVPNLYRQIKS